MGKLADPVILVAEILSNPIFSVIHLIWYEVGLEQLTVLINILIKTSPWGVHTIEHTVPMRERKNA